MTKVYRFSTELKNSVDGLRWGYQVRAYDSVYGRKYTRCTKWIAMISWGHALPSLDVGRCDP